MRAPVYITLAVAFTVPHTANAQKSPSYPEKPIRLVVPYPPSGGADVVGRLMAPLVSATLGKPATIDNRPGAAGMIGSDIVAKAPPDGYTLLLTTQGPITINPGLFPKMSYDPLRDLVPVALLASYSTVLTTHPSLPARSVKELIALAKARPGQIQYASGGNGTTQHLSGELLNAMAGIKLMHVPYKGGGPAFTDLLAGHVPVGFASPGLVLPHSKSGRLTLLAVTSAKRSPAFPNLPSIAETLPGFDSVAWVALFAPRGTPPEVVALWQRESLKSVRSPEVRNALAVQNYEVSDTPPEEFPAYVRQDFDKWSKLIARAGVKAD